LAEAYEACIPNQNYDSAHSRRKVVSESQMLLMKSLMKSWKTLRF